MSEFLFGIFARGGSKSIPNKNLLEIGDLTLVERTIIQAQRICRELDVPTERVYVSTDSPIISNLAKASGANVPFLRPSELAHDEAPELMAWKHLLDEFICANQKEKKPNLIVLPVTSPLRRDKDIIGCIDLFREQDFDLVFSGAVAKKNPYFNMFEISSNGSFVVSKPHLKLARRQESPLVYENNNAIYVSTFDYVLETSHLYQGKVGMFEMPQRYSVDIDTMLDYEIAQFLWKDSGGQ